MTEARRPDPGLHIVATPIGAARDITLRALDTLRMADVLAAEDTRNTRKLMEIHGIALGDRPLIAYHDHNGAAQRPRILAHLRDGKSVAYFSDAGTPMVADPGFALARAATEEGLPVFAAPGPSALLAALVVSGLPSDRFLFAGFPPPQPAARRNALRGLSSVPATLVFFETGRRLSGLLSDCVAELGGDRQGAICRELTKKFETVTRGTLVDLQGSISDGPPKGEIVLLIDRGVRVVSDADRDAALSEALRTMRVKDAARAVAEELGLPRRDVYQAALKIGDRT